MEGTDQSEEQGFPHLVDVVLLLDLGDPYSSIGGLLKINVNILSHVLPPTWVPHCL